MKRILASVLVLILALPLCSCASNGGTQASNAKGNTKVEEIEMDTGTAAVRYTGYEYLPDEFFAMGVGNREKSVYIKFEYTNKTDEPTNFKSDFNLTVEQNGQSLDMITAWNAEADVSAFMNYVNGTAVNETLPVYFPTVLKDYSPVTITVSAEKNGQTMVQTMVQEIQAKEGVIVPGETDVEPSELVGPWINPMNGDSLEVSEGTLNPSTNSVKGSSTFRPADRTLHTWSGGGRYNIEGDLFALPDERFRISKEDGKVYLTSLDTSTTYIRRSDFYRFEDIEVHQMGDTVETDAVKFTLTGYGYMEQIDPKALWEKGYASRKEPLVPDNGMVWANVSYQLSNLSNQAISMRASSNNVRFFVIYQNNFTFDMETYDWNYVTKGYGGDDHVEWTGSSSSNMELPPLIREEFDTWLPVASAVQEDADSPLHLLVLLPTSTGTKLFAYNLSGSAEQTAAVKAAAAKDMYGTWDVTEVRTSSGLVTVEKMESSNVYSWSDWRIVLTEKGSIYLQTNATSTEGDAVVTDTDITVGKNEWKLENGRLVLDTGGSSIYYDKTSDNQTFPSPTKAEIAGMLKGKWSFSVGSERTGYFSFSENTISAEINGVILDETRFNIIMPENRVNFTENASGIMVSMDLNYSYDNNILTLVYSGDTLIKQ